MAPEERLGMQIALLRWLAYEDEMRAVTFAYVFLSPVSRKANDSIMVFVDKLFLPTARDLRHQLVRELDRPGTTIQTTELSAGQRLLQGARARLKTIATVLGMAFVYLIDRFAGGFTGKAAETVWDALTTLLGSG